MGEHEERVRVPTLAGNHVDAAPLKQGTDSNKPRLHAPGEAPRPKSQRPLEQYLELNSQELWRDVTSYLRRVALPVPSPRLAWIDEDRFLLHALDYLAPMNLYLGRDPLTELLFPAKPYDSIAALVPSSPAWSTAIGTAIAPLVEQAMVGSLARLGPRWVELAENSPEPEGEADETKTLVAEQSLVPSHPMDLAVRRGLTVGRVVDLTSGLKHPSKRKQRAPRRKARVEWQGARDVALWNFVKPEPADATAEEVASALWSPRFWNAEGSIYAHRLTRTGGLWGVPAEMARAFAAAREHAPRPGTKVAPRSVAAAGSKAADELARGEAGKRRVSTQAIRSKLADSITRLEYLHGRLGVWKLDETVAVGLAWAKAKRAELATDAAKVSSLGAVIDAQHDVLARIVERVQPMLGVADAGARGPLRGVMALYARAAASSHLAQTSNALLDDAAVAQAQLVLSVLRDSTNEITALTSAPGADAAQVATAKQLATQSRMMQSRLLQGGTLDSAEFETTVLGSQELALEARISQIKAQLSELRAAASELDGVAHETVRAFNSRFRNFEQVAHGMDGHLDMVRADWDADTFDPRDASAESSRERIARRRAGLARAQARFDQIRQDKELIEVLQNGEAILRKQAKYTRIVKVIGFVLAMVALSFIGGGLGAVIGRVAGAWLSRAAALEGVGILVSTARFVGRHAKTGGAIAGGATDVAVNTAGQLVLQGGRVDQTLLENALQTLASAQILKRIGDDLEVAKQVDRQTKGLWTRRSRAATATLAYGATVSSHMIIGVATSYVAHQVATGVLSLKPQPGAQGISDAVEEVFMQGASVALGRYAAGRLASSKPFHDKLAKLRESAAFSRARAELARGAVAAEQHPNGTRALETLRLVHAMQREELALLTRLADDSAARDGAGISAAELTHQQRVGARAATELQRADVQTLALHAAHLDEVIPGELWKGTPKQIQHALKLAKRTHVVEATRDPETKRWEVTIGGRKLVIDERAGVAHATTKHGPRAGEATKLSGAVETRAEHVPGSEFRGQGNKEWGAAELGQSRQTLESVLRGRADVVGVEVVDGTALARGAKARAEYTVVVALKPASDNARPRHITIRVQHGPLAGETVARSWVNSTQQGYTPVKGGERRIEGRHVIQISDRLAPAHVERALAHEVAEIFAVDELNMAGTWAGPDALRAGAEGHVLSPHDRGRLAEVEVLGKSSDDHAVAELHALIDHLGLRSGAAGADRRFALAEQHLSKPVAERLHAMRAEPVAGTRDHTVVGAVRTRARADLAAEAERRRARDRIAHDMPSMHGADGKPLGKDDLATRAEAAADARAAKSAATLLELDALLGAHAGKPGYPVLPYEVMIGGGASLAARNRTHLLIDDRGRWQADGNAEIAQTGSQLKHVKDAKLGDPSLHAKPNERLSLDAVRAWEDDIAAQGPVVNGRGSLRVGSTGEMLIDILSSERAYTFRIDSVPIIASGFVPERIPGAPFQARLGALARDLQDAVEKIANDASLSTDVRDAASKARKRLLETQVVSNEDAQQLPAILHDDALRAALAANPGTANAAQTALEYGNAVKHWEALKAESPDHLLFGDGANIGVEQAKRSNHVIIAGTGGTGISAAEIVFANNAKAHVTMVGPDSPAGLLENDQFRELAQRHADAELAKDLKLTAKTTGRLHIRLGRVGAPKVEDRVAWDAIPNQRETDIDPKHRSKKVFDLNADTTTVKGTMYIAAVGRANDYPPVVAQLLDYARRNNGKYFVTPLFYDRQYVGYRVHILVKERHVDQTIEVTGAASRYLPIADARKNRGDGVTDKDFDGVERATGHWDRPPESGGFAGGYDATAAQTAYFALHRGDPKNVHREKEEL